VKILTDEHIPKVLVQALQEAGHAVTTVVELGMRGATDLDILQRAREEKTLILTEDKDFGRLLEFCTPDQRHCALLLRYETFVPATLIVDVLRALAELERYGDQKFMAVLMEGRLRIRTWAVV
jgi:predicted nuclease of predicted toxin-antitoxin system